MNGNDKKLVWREIQLRNHAGEFHPTLFLFVCFLKRGWMEDGGEELSFIV
jgi:hypothetical protein